MPTTRFGDDLADSEPAEAERYELHAAGVYAFEADRREFVQTLGAGLMIAVAANKAGAQQRGGSGDRSSELAARFHIGQDGILTVLTSTVEVGQGSRTQITQAAAEELRLPMDRVRLVMADTEQCPDDGGTAGSRTTPSTVPRVRRAAAAARAALAQRAAQRLGVAPARLEISGGIFRAGNKQLTLAELANDGPLNAAAAESDRAEITAVGEWRLLGTSVPKVNAEQVVTGEARYPADILRPGMLYGKVLRPVSYGATLRAIDLQPAQSMAGVVVVRDGSFVGCAASSSWQAGLAVDAVAGTAEWDESPHVSSDDLFDHFKRTAQESRRRRGRGPWGDFARAIGGAQQQIEQRYTVAYIQHAPMEPRAAVAEWQDGRLTVWTGSQQPSRVQRELSEAFRVGEDRVRVIVPDTGGGFGGKHTGEAAVEAARLSKAAGRSVSLRWTREEEFTWAYFRPAGLIEVRAGLDRSGDLVGWDFANYNSGGSAIETPYRVPNGRTRFLSADSPLRQGSYRALASTANTFARESAMDELAELAGSDPLDFRLRHLPDGRLKDVLRAAAAKFDWPRRRAKSPHRGVGLACGTEKGSFVAACAEVEVVGESLRVLEICQAFECGAMHNPDNVRAQVEGCIVMGLGGALHEEIQFKEGRISNPSFSSYRVPRMDDLPKLDIVLLNRPDLDSVGAGETPIIAVAPAIANAIQHATGIRSRSLPLRLS